MFHFPSFLIGYASGVATVMLAKRFSPALSELAAAAFGIADSLSAAVAAGFEDVEDLFAEARSKATANWSAQPAPARAKVLRAVPRRDAAAPARPRSAKKSAPARRKQTT